MPPPPSSFPEESASPSFSPSRTSLRRATVLPSSLASRWEVPSRPPHTGESLRVTSNESVVPTQLICCCFWVLVRFTRFSTGLFLDPKGRGGTTGYDMAVALPGLQSGEEGDDDLFKENNKTFDITDGKIEFEVNKVNAEEQVRFASPRT